MVVLSIVFISHRKKNAKEIINSWLNQTVKPEKIHIFISKKGFYLDNGIKQFPKFDSEIVDVNYVENIGALRKFIPVLKKYRDQPNKKIVLSDDDHKYYKTYLEDLLSYEKKLNGVVASNGNVYHNKNPNNWKKTFFNGTKLNKPKRADIISTGYGCLIKPKFFTKEIFEWKNYKKYGVPYDDEFFVNYLLAKNDINRWVIPIKHKPHKFKTEVDMFKSDKSRKSKGKITKEYKDVIMSI